MIYRAAALAAPQHDDSALIKLNSCTCCLELCIRQAQKPSFSVCLEATSQLPGFLRKARNTCLPLPAPFSPPYLPVVHVFTIQVIAFAIDEERAGEADPAELASVVVLSVRVHWPAAKEGQARPKMVKCS